MLLRSDYFTSFDYQPVNLPYLELELGDDTNLVVSLDGGKTFIPLGESAFEQLVGYLGAPVGFARKLRKAGRGHVLSYLHKQLAQTVGLDPYTAVVHATEGLVGLAEKSSLFYRSSDSVELDKRLQDWLSQSSCPFFLKSYRADSGDVRYLVFFKQEGLIPEDKSNADPLWRWGYELRYSLWGTEPASFQVGLERKSSQSFAYLPEEHYYYPITFDPSPTQRIESVFTFLNAAPEPRWKDLSWFVQRLRREQASLQEVKTVRKKVISFLKDQEGDNSEAKERVNKACDWKNIEEAYGLKDLEEKPSVQWLKRASTPVNLFDLYNLLSQEVSYAPNSVDPKTREQLLTLAGKLLSQKPDLEDLPPRIDWGQRHFEQKTLPSQTSV